MLQWCKCIELKQNLIFQKENDNIKISELIRGRKEAQDNLNLAYDSVRFKINYLISLDWM